MHISLQIGSSSSSSMMKPSTLLRTLSSKLPSRLSTPPVSPLPPTRTAFDRWLAAELDDLRLSPRWPECRTAARCQVKLLDVAVEVQAMAARFVSEAAAAEKAADEYLNDSVELLDACNGLRQMMWEVRGYLASTETALRYIEANSELSGRMLRRSKAALAYGEPKMRKSSSNLRRMAEKITHEARLDPFAPTDEPVEALQASRAVALFAISMVEAAFSLNPRRGPLPPPAACRKGASWASSLCELQRGAKDEFERRHKGGLKGLAAAANVVRELIGERINGKAAGSADGGELKEEIGVLRRRFGEMEEGVQAMELGVDELYRGLVAIRMALLDKSGRISGIFNRLMVVKIKEFDRRSK